ADKTLRFGRAAVFASGPGRARSGHQVYEDRKQSAASGRGGAQLCKQDLERVAFCVDEPGELFECRVAMGSVRRAAGSMDTFAPQRDDSRSDRGARRVSN